MNKTYQIIANVSSLVTIISFCISLDTKFKLWQTILIVIVIILILSLLAFELFCRPKKYKNKHQINNYMKNWIAKPGRTVILTRDMSWVDNKEIEDELRNKAVAGELIICQPVTTDLTKSLKDNGAEVYTYESLGFIPKSRFTFINYGSNSSKVAIGRKDKNHNHIITEFSTSDTIEYFLAEDLVNLIKKIGQNGN